MKALNFIRYDNVRIDRIALNSTVNWTIAETHAKFAISYNNNLYLVCPADINFDESQRNRGGGAICFKSQPLWTFLNNSHSIFALSRCYTAPLTMSPTTNPTLSPTISPTISPSLSPTISASPTSSLNPTSSLSPTNAPSMNPVAPNMSPLAPTPVSTPSQVPTFNNSNTTSAPQGMK